MTGVRAAPVGAAVVTGAGVLGCTALLVGYRTAPSALIVAAGVLALVTAGAALASSRRAASPVVATLLGLLGVGEALLALRETWFVLAAAGQLAITPEAAAWLRESGWWLVAVIALLLLLFPDGRVPSPRWRVVPPMLIITVAIGQVSGAFDPSPYAAPLKTLPRPYDPLPAPLAAISVAAFVLQIGLTVACAGSVVFRFRRAAARERAQLKWLAVIGLAAALFPVVCLVEIALTGQTGWATGLIQFAVGLTLPLTVLAATDPRTLHRADFALSTSLTYAVLTSVVILGYAATAFGVGLLVGRESAIVAALVATVGALLLAPVRSRLQRRIDQRFFPLRRTALRAIADLQHRVHAGTGQPEEIEQVLQAALGDKDLRVGLQIPGAEGLRDLSGRPMSGSGVPVRLGEVQVGALSSPSAASQSVLVDCATEIATLLEVARLREQLATAVREVEASRTRLVQAGTAERLRLERDLHDGAQQRLVALGMALRVAQRGLPAGDAAYAVLDHGVAQLATAVAELRQIAHGLRPSSLDDGLVAALEAWSRDLPTPIEVEAGIGELPDDIATTAYFVAAEAVTNATRYADAQRIVVRVSQSDSSVVISVSDDGRGGARPTPGSGLAGLADRVAALRGTLTVESPLGGGTLVRAVLPCGS